MATTHHGILKNYGATRPGAQNASMGFDRETLGPTYRILMGVPGESHALEIARRSGMPEEILSSAFSYLDDERTDISRLVSNLAERHQTLVEAEEIHKSREHELKEKWRRTDLKELTLRQKELELRRHGLKEVRDFLGQARREWEALREKAGAAAAPEFGALAARIQDTIEREEQRIEKESDALAPAASFEVKAGMDVLIRRTGRRGKVVRKDKGKRWIVETETLRLSLLPGELLPASQAADFASASVAVSYAPSAPMDPPVLELHLRGMRLEEAMRRLEKQIDNALISGLHEFSVVHGKGEGVLRTAIHEYLRTLPVVADFRFSAPEEGGFGKTIVTLKGRFALRHPDPMPCTPVGGTLVWRDGFRAVSSLFSSWQIIAVCLLLMFLLPLVFFVASTKSRKRSSSRAPKKRPTREKVVSLSRRLPPKMAGPPRGLKGEAETGLSRWNEKDHHSGCPGAQPQEHRPGDTSGRPGRRLGPQRIRQVIPGLRHDIRRRADAGTWSPSPPTRGSSSGGLTSPTWITSRDFRRPSPSSRRPPTATRARRWEPSRKSTTISASFSPGSALPTVPLRPGNPGAVGGPDRGFPAGAPPGNAGALLAPVVGAKKGEHQKILEDAKRMGYVRARIDGEIRALEEDISLDKRRAHSIEIVVDRLVVAPDTRRRLAESVEGALETAGGTLIALVREKDGERELLFSQKSACATCGISVPELQPRLFSFNNPFGACPDCSGLGVTLEFDPALVVPDPRSPSTRAASPRTIQRPTGTAASSNLWQSISASPWIPRWRTFRRRCMRQSCGAPRRRSASATRARTAGGSGNTNRASAAF